MLRRTILIIGCVALLLGAAGPAPAGMLLTTEGQSAGFQLSTFASGFDTFGAGNGVGGPFGVAFASNGNVLVSELNGIIYVFPSDANNQTVSGAQVGTQYNSFDPLGMTQANGKIYLGFQSSGIVAQVDNNGAIVSTVATGLNGPHGMAINPTNGHLLVSSDTGSIFGSGIYDINLATNQLTNIVSTGSYDGITTDGNFVYGAREDGEIVAFNLSNPSQSVDLGNIAGADGIAVGTGVLGGNLFVNTNFGQLVQINLKTNAQTVIATGGSRGDFVAVDPNDGSLFLDQSDSILRLTPPPGGGFGTVPTPEPASFVLFSFGMAGLTLYSWRRRKSAAGQGAARP